MYSDFWREGEAEFDNLSENEVAPPRKKSKASKKVAKPMKPKFEYVNSIIITA